MTENYAISVSIWLTITALSIIVAVFRAMTGLIAWRDVPNVFRLGEESLTFNQVLVLCSYIGLFIFGTIFIYNFFYHLIK